MTSVRLTGLPAVLPPWHIIKERRATFAALPEENAKPAAIADPLAKSLSRRRLDGDWTPCHHRGCHPIGQ